MNIFLGLIGVHEFFSVKFPLREYFFLYFARPPPPPPHNFSNGPSLIQGKPRTAIRGLTRVIFLSGVSKKSATNDIVKQQATSKDIKKRGAQLHLIIQFPILNTSGISDPVKLASRQKEYIYCLQRNLLSPDVSSPNWPFSSSHKPLFQNEAKCLFSCK